MQAMVASAAIQGSWLALPADLKAVVPESGVMAAAVGVLILGVIGRLVDQGGSDGSA